MAELKKGDVVYHKATGKRCVVSGFDGERVQVTTEDDKVRIYEPEELMTEEERSEKNRLIVDTVPEKDKEF